MSDVAQAASVNTPFIGSYCPEDCLFLLKPITPEYKNIQDKEALIQTGRLHYSETVSLEQAPSDRYTQLFLAMTEQYKQRLAQEVMRLASMICQRRDGPVTLLSLARAGTPIGVLLQRALTRFYGKNSRHYSISIIRDRGIDTAALDYVLAQGHDPSSIVFVDGWTAKGVITRELQQSVADYNRARAVSVPAELFVISDIGGTADVQATFDDYTIPSALMNSTVSGLISRSILNDQIAAGEFHGCVSYDHLRHCDRSRWFVDTVSEAMCADSLAPEPTDTRQQRRHITSAFLDHISKTREVSDINRIKPGIAEATRVLLRRVPDLVLLRQRDHVDTLHLERLASEKQVPLVIEPDMPFGACSLIKDVSKQGG